MKNILLDLGGKYLSQNEMGNVGSIDLDAYLMDLHDKTHSTFESKMLIESLIDRVDPYLSKIPWFVETNYTLSFTGKNDYYKQIPFKKKYEMAIADGFDMVLQFNISEGPNSARIFYNNVDIDNSATIALKEITKEVFPLMDVIEVLDGGLQYDDFVYDEVCRDMSFFGKQIISVNLYIDEAFTKSLQMKKKESYVHFIFYIFSLLTLIVEFKE